MIKKRNVDPKQIAYQVMIDNGLKIKNNAARNSKSVRLVVCRDKVSVLPGEISKKVNIAGEKIEVKPKSHRIRGDYNVKSLILREEVGSQSEYNEVHFYKKIPNKSDE